MVYGLGFNSILLTVNCTGGLDHRVRPCPPVFPAGARDASGRDGRRVMKRHEQLQQRGYADANLARAMAGADACAASTPRDGGGHGVPPHTLSGVSSLPDAKRPSPPLQKRLSRLARLIHRAARAAHAPDLLRVSGVSLRPG